MFDALLQICSSLPLSLCLSSKMSFDCLQKCDLKQLDSEQQWWKLQEDIPEHC